MYIWRQRRQALGIVEEEREEEGQQEQPKSRGLRQSLRVIFASKYVLIIAAIIFISSVVTKLLEWQFTAISYSEYARIHPEDTKNFVAAFWGAVGLLALMPGGLATHLWAGQWALVPMPILTGILLGVVAWMQRPERVRAWQRRSPDCSRHASASSRPCATSGCP